MVKLGQAISLEMNRKLTDWFIQQDQVELALVPRVAERRPGGGTAYVDGDPRPPQPFTLIPIGSSFDGVVNSGDGTQIQYEFVIVGKWDAEIEIGDHWADDRGNDWEVAGFIPFNQYEVKAGVRAYGGYPAA